MAADQRVINFEKKTQLLDGCGWIVHLVLDLLGRSILRLRKIRLRVLIQLLQQVVRVDDRRADGCVGPSLERHFSALFFRWRFRQHFRKRTRIAFPTRLVSAGRACWQGLHVRREALAVLVDLGGAQRA